MSFVLVIIIEAALVAFFVLGYVLWRRNRRTTQRPSSGDDASRHAPLLILLAGTAAFAGACERDRTQPAAAAPEASAAAGENAGFVLLHGSDTLAIERFTRTEASLDGQIVDHASGARLHYLARLGAASRVRRLEVELFANGGTESQLSADLTFVGDTIVVAQVIDGESSEDRTTLPPGTTLYLNPSIAMLELLLERAAADSTFPVLSISADGPPRLVEPSVVRQNGTVRFIIPGETDVELRVADQTRIVSGAAAAGEARFERLR